MDCVSTTTTPAAIQKFDFASIQTAQPDNLKRSVQFSYSHRYCQPKPTLSHAGDETSMAEIKTENVRVTPNKIGRNSSLRDCR